MIVNIKGYSKLKISEDEIEIVISNGEDKVGIYSDNDLVGEETRYINPNLEKTIVYIDKTGLCIGKE